MYSYGGYPAPGGYYAPPMPDQLAQLRQNQFQQPMMNQPMMQQQQPMQPAMQQPIAQPNQPMNALSENSNIIWVSGVQQVDDYPMGPNSAVEFRDLNGKVMYVKQRDASGKPSTEVYDIYKRETDQPIQTQQAPIIDYVPREEFNTLQAKFETLQAKFETLAQRKPATKRKEDTDNE